MREDDVFNWKIMERNLTKNTDINIYEEDDQETHNRTVNYTKMALANWAFCVTPKIVNHAARIVGPNIGW